MLGSVPTRDPEPAMAAVSGPDTTDGAESTADRTGARTPPGTGPTVGAGPVGEGRGVPVVGDAWPTGKAPGGDREPTEGPPGPARDAGRTAAPAGRASSIETSRLKTKAAPTPARRRRARPVRPGGEPGSGADSLAA